jgi:2-phosphoglycerate kinase
MSPQFFSSYSLVSPRDEALLDDLKPKRCSIPAECMDETRQDILTKANSWIKNLDALNILWVSSHPGVGKSTIASTLVASLGASHHPGSSFFFA